MTRRLFLSWREHTRSSRLLSHLADSIIAKRNRALLGRITAAWSARARVLAVRKRALLKIIRTVAYRYYCRWTRDHAPPLGTAAPGASLHSPLTRGSRVTQFSRRALSLDGKDFLLLNAYMAEWRLRVEDWWRLDAEAHRQQLVQGLMDTATVFDSYRLLSWCMSRWRQAWSHACSQRAIDAAGMWADTERVLALRASSPVSLGRSDNATDESSAPPLKALLDHAVPNSPTPSVPVEQDPSLGSADTATDAATAVIGTSSSTHQRAPAVRIRVHSPAQHAAARCIIRVHSDRAAHQPTSGVRLRSPGSASDMEHGVVDGDDVRLMFSRQSGGSNVTAEVHSPPLTRHRITVRSPEREVIIQPRLRPLTTLPGVPAAATQ